MVSDWRPSTWGEEVTLEYGKAIRGYNSAQGKYRVFGSNGPIGWTSEALAQGPGVILGRKGAYRGVEYWKEPFWVIDTAYYLVPRTELDMRWLYYAVKHYKLGEVDDGSPIPSTTRAAVYMLDIDVPPLSEQRAIAHILGTLDDKIELNRRRNQTLEAMARALFKDWFVDFGPVRAKMEGREPYLSADIWQLFPSSLSSSDLGKIPDKWPIDEIGNHLDVLATGRRPKGGVAGISAGIPSVGAESILGIGRFDYGKTKYVTEEFFSSMKSGHAESLDVMLYKDGGKPGDFKPRVSMFGRGFPFERFAINEHVFRLRSDTLGQPFLYFQMSDERVLNDLRNRGGKAAIPGINQTDVRTLRLAVPPKKLLSAFNEHASPTISGILDNARESSLLANLRDALLPKLISGELRVANAEQFLKERAL